MNCLVVCQAGRMIGLGHLTRSLVAARALHQALGATVFLLVHGDVVERADLRAFQHYELRIEDNLSEAVRHLAREQAADVVIFDLFPPLVPPDLDALLEDLRRDGRKTVSIDALRDHAGELDLLFVPSSRYSATNALNGAAPVMFGWDCLLLNGRRRTLDWRPGNRVLVLTGGSDVTGLGKTLPSLLDQGLRAGSVIHWVTGPFAAAPVVPPTARLRMVIHASPDGLDGLMSESDYAVTVFGVGLFELLHHGVPTVVFSLYENKHSEELSELSAEGVAVVAEDQQDAVVKLRLLMADDQRAAELSRRATQRISDSGGQRFAQAVSKLVG